MKSVVLVLGDQLFAPEHLRGWEGADLYMAEDWELATRTRHHKKKLVYFFAAMRGHARALQAAGWNVRYGRITEDDSREPFEKKLLAFLREKKATTLRGFEIEDKFFEERIRRLCEENGIGFDSRTSPMFLTGREEFTQYLASVKKPFMKQFYERQRRRLGILVTAEGEPVGGRWSFDEDNREPLPKGWRATVPPAFERSQDVAGACSDVQRLFKDHVGSTSEFWIPTTRTQWLSWLEEFLRSRLHEFGSYEDSLSLDFDFVSHSVLTPALNVGLLTPSEVVERTLAYARDHDVPLNSLEGFLRQIIGWREFVRGVYRAHSSTQETSNAWGHERRLADCWWTGKTEILPLDAAISKALRLGWTHHIERLMILSNVMFLCETQPQDAHRWFMEMFVDSADWVMGPNVYGMGQNSDGGLMTTKPYLCGSNYLLKMGRYPKGPWTEELDGLYWRWVIKNKARLVKNPRMAQTARASERLEPLRRERILAAGERAVKRLTK
jgi:deoxyribodipyrimidine photolyase-related protein